MVERETYQPSDSDSDHNVSGSGSEKSSRPILLVHSLWRQACTRLLDIDTEMPPSPSSPSALSPSTSTTSTSPSLSLDPGSTWDQRFFSQMEISDTARVSVQDMMLCVLRVGVRCLLSREGVHSIDVAVDGKFLHNLIFLSFYAT